VWEWRYKSTVLDLGTRWGWVVRLTPRPLYSQGTPPPYPLDRRLGGPQSQSRHCVQEKSYPRHPFRSPLLTDVVISPVLWIGEIFAFVVWHCAESVAIDVSINVCGCQNHEQQRQAARVYIPREFRQANKLRGFSPPPNYTNRATAACRRS
jgi:hypothetical protein